MRELCEHLPRSRPGRAKRPERNRRVCRALTQTAVMRARCRLITGRSAKAPRLLRQPRFEQRRDRWHTLGPSCARLSRIPILSHRAGSWEMERAGRSRPRTARRRVVRLQVACAAAVPREGAAELALGGGGGAPAAAAAAAAKMKAILMKTKTRVKAVSLRARGLPFGRGATHPCRRVAAHANTVWRRTGVDLLEV